MKKPSKFHVFLSLRLLLLRLLLLSCSFVAVLWLRCQFKTSSQRSLNGTRGYDRYDRYDRNNRIRKGEEVLLEERKARFIPPQQPPRRQENLESQ